MEGKSDGFFSHATGKVVRGIRQVFPVLAGKSRPTPKDSNVIVGKTEPVKSLEPAVPVLATRGISTDRKNQGK